MEELRENARRKSVGSEKVKVARVKVKVLKKYFTIAISTICILAVTNVVQLGSDISDYISKSKVVREYLNEVGERTSAESHPAANYIDHYYDVGDLISYITEVPDEIPERMYGVMRHMGFEHLYNTDEFDAIVRGVYRDEEGKSVYSSFEEFLVENKFVDKNGKASTDEYGDRMKDYIFAKEEYKEQLESIKGNIR